MSIPHDNIIEICLRLSVKDLLRFRAISKIWCGFIDDPLFINAHIQKSTQTKSNYHIILAENGSPNEVYSSSVDDGLQNLVNLNSPLKSKIFVTQIVGCCNGLVLLKSGENLCLWNPFTKKHKNLALPPVWSDSEELSPCYVYSSCGFGHDPLRDVYKVVKLEEIFTVKPWPLRVKIYSLDSNSWKLGQDFTWHGLCQPYGKYAEGALYWFAVNTLSKAETLLALEVGTERFQEVPLPIYNKESNVDKSLDVFEGSLCFCEIDCRIGLKIHLMKKKGLEFVWGHQYTISVPCDLDNIRRLMCSQRRTDDKGEIVLSKDFKNFIWYGLENKKGRKVKFHNMPNEFQFDMCEESLVRPRSDGEVDL